MLKHERQPGEATTWSEFVAQRQQAAKDDGQGGAGQLANAAQKRKGLAGVKKRPRGQKGVHPGGAPSPHGASSRGGANADATLGTKGGAQAKGTISIEEDVDWLLGVLDTQGAAGKSSATTPRRDEVALPRKPVKTFRPSLANRTRVKCNPLPQNSAKKGLPSGPEQVLDPEDRKDGFPVKHDVSFGHGGNEAVASHTGEVQPAFKKRASKVKGIAANNKTGQATNKQGASVSGETGETKAAGERLASAGTKTTSKRAAKAVCEEEPSAEEETGPAPKRPRGAGPVGGGKAGGRLQRLRQERESKGLLLLPEKVERRIYQVKKAMRKKGLPGEEIKQVVRKMRRKEELLFRRQLAKLCFKCRQPGHKVSDCPQVLQDPGEAVGICFKCGSTEHFSSACNVQTSKGNEFPYAKCFICKQQGHISRKCPRNDKGVYPKGGHCSFCGGIDHFKRECPEMEKNKKKNAAEREEFAGDIASIDQSADAENVPALQPLSQGKKAKVVSF